MRTFKKFAQKTLTMLPAKGGVVKRSENKGKAKAAKPAEKPDEVLMPQGLMDGMKEYFDHARTLASTPSFQSDLEAMGISPEDAKLLAIGPDFAQLSTMFKSGDFPFTRDLLINLYTYESAYSKKSIASIDYATYRDTIATTVSKAVDRDSGWCVAAKAAPLYAVAYVAHML